MHRWKRSPKPTARWSRCPIRSQHRNHGRGRDAEAVRDRDRDRRASRLRRHRKRRWAVERKRLSSRRRCRLRCRDRAPGVGLIFQRVHHNKPALLPRRRKRRRAMERGRLRSRNQSRSQLRNHGRPRDIGRILQRHRRNERDSSLQNRHRFHRSLGPQAPETIARSTTFRRNH